MSIKADWERGTGRRGTARLVVVTPKPHSLLCLTDTWQNRESFDSSNYGFELSLEIQILPNITLPGRCKLCSRLLFTWRRWAWLFLGSLKLAYVYWALCNHIVHVFLCQYSMIFFSGLSHGKWSIPSSKLASKSQMCCIISFSKANINWEFSTTRSW